MSHHLIAASLRDAALVFLVSAVMAVSAAAGNAWRAVISPPIAGSVDWEASQVYTAMAPTTSTTSPIPSSRRQRDRGATDVVRIVCIPCLCFYRGLLDEPWRWLFS